MFIKHLYILSVSALLANSAFAQALSESDVIQLGMAHPAVQQLITAKQKQVDVGIAKNRLWHNPSIAISHETLADEKETALEVEQTIDWSGRRGLRENKLELQRELVSHENAIFIAQRQALLSDTFYKLLHSQQQLNLVQNWLSRFKGIVETIRKQTESGEASKHALRRIRAEQQSIQLQLAEKQAEHDRIRIQLSALIAQSIASDVQGELKPAHLPPLAELEQKLAKHPSLLAKKIQLKMTDADREIASNLTPEVTFGLGTKQVSDHSIRNTGTMFSLSLDLPVFEQGEEQVQQADAEYAQAEAELLLLEQQLKSELAGLYQQLSQLLIAADRYQSTVNEITPALLNTSETAYQAGEFSLYELLDSYQSAVDAELRYLDLQLQTRQLYAKLNRLLTGGNGS